MDTEYVTLAKFCTDTGRTKMSIYKKIHKGTWIEGKHYLKDPDGRIQINTEAYRRWLEGDRALV